MPNQRAKDKRQVSAWIPLAQYLALKFASSALGCHISDIVARLVERYATAEIEAMKKERETKIYQMVASNKSNTKGKKREGLC